MLHYRAGRYLRSSSPFLPHVNVFIPWFPTPKISTRLETELDQQSAQTNHKDKPVDLGLLNAHRERKEGVSRIESLLTGEVDASTVASVWPAQPAIAWFGTKES